MALGLLLVALGLLAFEVLTAALSLATYGTPTETS